MIYFFETETEMVEKLLAISKVIQVTSRNNTFLRKSKIFSLKFYYLKPSHQWLELFTDCLDKNFPSIDTDGKKCFFALSDLT